jgi:hypothetical protein
MMKYSVVVIALCALLVSCGLLLEQPPGSAIAISAVSAVPQQTSVTIVWTTDIPSTHLVRYGTLHGVYPLSTVESTTPTVLHSVIMTSLGSNTTYYFVAQNNASGAASATSVEGSFATASSITISGQTEGSITLTSAAVAWNTNLGTTHLVEYGTISGVYTSSTLESVVPATVHSVSLTGLAPATTYYYRVKNFNPSFSTVSSIERSFVTLTEAAPTTVQKLRGIWIIGGLSASGVPATAITSTVAQVDLYDPVADAWYPNVTSLPTPVSFAAAVSWGGKIYVMGGFDSSGAVQSLTQEYTVSTNSWATRSPIGGGGSTRANISSVIINNKIYVLGGTTANYNTAYAGSTTSYEYNPASDTWASKVAITVAARSEILELNFNDVVFHLGGRSAAAVVQSTHDGLAVSMSPPNGALTTGITEVALLTYGRTGHCGVLYTPAANPAMMVLVGGFSALTLTTGCHAFFGATAATPIPSLNNLQYLPFPFAAPAAWQNAVNGYSIPCGFSAAALYGSTLYVFGGATSYNSGPILNVGSFNLDNLYSGGGGAWTSRSNMPNSGRYGHKAVTINP